MVQTVQARASVADSEDNIDVFMQQVATTSGRDEHPVLTTIGVSWCVAVTLYDPESQAGSLAHFSAMNNTKALQSTLAGMLYSLQKAGFSQEDRSQLQIHVLGDYEHDGTLQQRVLTALRGMGLPEPVEVGYASDPLGLCIALDTRTGEVLDLEKPFFFREISEDEDRLRDLRAQLPWAYYTDDPRVSSYEVFIAS